MGSVSQGKADRILCSCYDVPEGVVREAVTRNGLASIREVTRLTRAGGGCYTCWPEIRGILAEAGAPAAAEAAELLEETRRLLEGELKELFALNGLHARAIEAEGGRVYAEFRGEGPRAGTASLAGLRDHLAARLSAVCGIDVEVCDIYIEEIGGEGVSAL